MKFYYKTNHLQDALGLLHEMEERRNMSNVITYTILMNFYSKTGHSRVSLGLLHEMGERGILLDVISC